MARKSDLLFGEQRPVDDSGRKNKPFRVDGLRELWFDSAPLALEHSRTACTKPLGGDNYIGGHNCGTMHGIWQHLLLLDLTANPERNKIFYREQISRLAQERGHRRVLIAGCCDYTMLAIALSAYDDVDITPDITIIDRCDTPLFLCRWFAEQFNCQIATKKTDMLTFAPDASFDLICTDGLITVFDQALRPDLIASWHRVLKPGGCVVTTNNLGHADKVTHLPAKTVAALSEKAVVARKELGLDLNLSDQDLRRYAHNFFSRPRPKYVNSAEDLRALFPPSQFRIDHLYLSEIDGMAIGDTDANGDIRKTLNARIIAERI